MTSNETRQPRAPNAATLAGVGTPKYTKLLTPQEYEKLTIDEKAEYITAMATVLKSRIPDRTSPPDPDETNLTQDPPASDGTSPPQNDPPAPEGKPQESSNAPPASGSAA